MHIIIRHCGVRDNISHLLGLTLLAAEAFYEAVPTIFSSLLRGIGDVLKLTPSSQNLLLVDTHGQARGTLPYGPNLNNR